MEELEQGMVFGQIIMTNNLTEYLTSEQLLAIGLHYIVQVLTKLMHPIPSISDKKSDKNKAQRNGIPCSCSITFTSMEF